MNTSKNTLHALTPPLSAFRETRGGEDVITARGPSPALFLFVFLGWFGLLLWFHPRLNELISISDGYLQWGALKFFQLFVELAWLYGFYNIGVIIFALIYRHSSKEKVIQQPLSADPPHVAILYTTCNDFVEESALSCVKQEYKNFTLYMLDDSSDPLYKAKVDKFAAAYPQRVQVVRRADRSGYKAGNLNNALGGVASAEPYFTLADADEILPPNFLSRLIPRIDADPTCGFIQSNHRCNPKATSLLARAMGDGIDIHWRWYQPLRNWYGFVMLLGHGAVLRSKCWEEVGGFPEIVSEDLAYAVRVREKGYKGIFAEDVICFEDFPDTIEAFRIRFMKWTRGTCELLRYEMVRILRAKKISVVEKCDILFPTLNLPLSLLYFFFVIDANVVIPLLFGTSQPVTFVLWDYEFIIPLFSLTSGFDVVFTADFFIITALTLFAPIICFIIELAPRPIYLFKFLCRSTAVYAALGPISSLGVFSYLITGKAKFLVTGDRSSENTFGQKVVKTTFLKKFFSGVREMFQESHPNHSMVQGFEIFCGLFFSLCAILLMNLSFLGLAFAFILHPLMHRITWEHRATQVLVYIPFVFILTGVGIGGIGLLGFQTVFFGFGFHF